MLQIKDISKEYRTGSLIQRALDHVSLNLRDNEFVAILGPSGSGKTTLLNIIGGLDRYDSGDLVINGISTKKYKDRDWDSYRNHTIGFVFQSYNLIPHQTVLANVELALTISGISGAERKRRSIEALEKVGLGEQIHKKPNQMSGGQMQRVALARALVNDPDILLADEPTGALDSETSVQVMDLLKEVAKDRLVVMVTHNPELAEEYATRIVRVKDGHIQNDTDPFIVDESNIPEAKHMNMGKSSMSFLTALALSMNNLMTKKARTILVSFAGSIGIIGIALILSLSNGVNKYIHDTEQETLSEYPLEIDRTAYDLTSMMESSGAAAPESDAAEETEEESEEETEVRERKVVENMFGGMTKNDLASLKTYIETEGDEIRDHSRSIEYKYNVEPYLYLSDTSEAVRRVNPDSLMSSSGLAPTSSLYSSAFSMNSFHQLPQDSVLYESSYDVKAGRWPSAWNEAVVVLTQSGSVTDMTLYTLGLKDYSELEKLISSVQSDNEEKVTLSEDDGKWKYNDLIGVTYKLINASDAYTYDDSLKVWTDRSSDHDYMKKIVDNGEEIKVVGVVQPSEGSDIAMLTAGIGYTYDLTEKIMTDAMDSEAVKAQLADEETNIFTGNSFGDDNASAFNMEDMFSFDEKALQSLFSFDTSKMGSAMDFSNMSNMDLSSMNLPGVSASDLSDILNGLEIDTSKVDLSKLVTDVFNDFVSTDERYGKTVNALQAYLQDETSAGARQILSTDLAKMLQANFNANREEIQSDFETEIGKLSQMYQESLGEGEIFTPDGFSDFVAENEEAQNELASFLGGEFTKISLSEEQIQTLAQSLADGFEAYPANEGLGMEDLAKEFQTYMSDGKGQQAIVTSLSGMLDLNSIEDQLSARVTEKMGSYTSAMGEAIGNMIQQMVALSASNLTNAFNFSPDALQNAFKFNLDADQLQKSLASMMTSGTASYEDNLSKLGYAKKDTPNAIIIYPNDFEAKTAIKDALDKYSEDMKKSGQEEKAIVYTDVVGTLMGSVTNIVNVISYVLIAFVAISLVVSSIMIGVITYISVLERQKEIGILRAIGASKRNISNVFNAETFITGLLAGVFGIVLTLLLLIPGNAIIRAVSPDTNMTAALPVGAAFFLIGLSVVLTLIGGIIPSRKASKSDPVKALRTE